MMGDTETTIRFCDRLFEEGVFGTSGRLPDRAPSTGPGSGPSSPRPTRDELLDQALAAFDRVGRELGVIGG